MIKKVLTKGLYRSLLLCSSLLITTSAFADRTQIRFCTDSIHGIGDSKPNVWYGVALKIDDQTVKSFSSCTVDSLRFAVAPTAAEKVTVFITRDLSSSPAWEKELDIKAGTWQSVAVDDGFKIDGKPFYIGYRLFCTSFFDQPMGFDMAASSPYSNLGSYLVASSEALIPLSWNVPPKALGNPTVSCIVSGDNIPATYVCPANVTFGEYQKPKVPFRVVIPVNNLGTTPLEKVTFEMTAGNNAPKTLTITPEKPLPAGSFGVLRFDATIDDDAVEETVCFKIMSVNGTDNQAGNPSVSGPVTCSADLFSRAFVVEDYTGSQCGYCPIGYVAMDKLTEDYKNKTDRFIPIGIHNYSTSAIHCDSYDDFIKYYNFASAPSSIINRDKESFPSYNNLKAAWAEMTQLAVADVKLEASYPSEDKSEVKVTATTEFVRDYDNADYGLAFILTEDNVGPYMQTNYYNDNPSVPEFYQKGEHVLMMYNHVARMIEGWNGIKGSVPSSIVKGTQYPYTTTISLETINIPDFSRLICLLIRKSDGIIVNAEYVDLKDVEYNGVESVSTERTLDHTEYYSLTGLRINQPVKGSVCLEKQVYSDGSTKVIKTVN